MIRRNVFPVHAYCANAMQKYLHFNDILEELEFQILFTKFVTSNAAENALLVLCIPLLIEHKAITWNEYGPWPNIWCYWTAMDWSCICEWHMSLINKTEFMIIVLKIVLHKSIVLLLFRIQQSH